MRITRAGGGAVWLSLSCELIAEMRHGRRVTHEEITAVYHEITKPWGMDKAKPNDLLEIPARRLLFIALFDKMWEAHAAEGKQRFAAMGKPAQLLEMGCFHLPWGGPVWRPS